MEEPELLRVVLPGGQDQVVARQTQSPLHGGVERPVQHHIVHPWGLNQLRELHGPWAAAAWGMTTPPGGRRLIRPDEAPPNGRAREVEPRPGWGGAARPAGCAPLAGTRPQRRPGGRPGKSRCHRPLTGGPRRRRTQRRAASEPEPSR